MESIRPRKPVEFLEALWRRKLPIFLAASAMLISTLIVIKRIPNVYESRALIAISNPGNNDDRLVLGTPFATLSQQLTSYANLVAMIRRNNLYQPLTNIESTVERLRKEIKLDVKMRNTYPDGPESVTISYRNADPAVAQKVVADCVALFEQANTTMRLQAASETGRLAEKVAEVEERLRQLGPPHELAQGREKSSDRADSDSLLIRTQRLATSAAVESLSDKEFALERQIDEQQRLVAEQENLVKALPAANRSTTTSAYGVLLSRKADLDAQIKNLATQYTEKNPKMILVQTQLKEVEHQIAQLEKNDEATGNLNSAALSPEARELRSSRRELARMQTDLDVTRRELGRKKGALSELPEASASAPPASGTPPDKAASLRTEYDRLISRHTWLLDKQDALQKLIGAIGPNAALFQLVDAPRMPNSPAAPNRLTLMLIALGLSVGLGLVVAALREAPQWLLINNDRDVQYYLGAPVLAVIPESYTPMERSRLRRMLAARWLGLTLLAAALIPIFIAILSRLQIFQILGSK